MMSPQAMELIDAPETKKPASPFELTKEKEIVASQPLKTADCVPSKTNEGRDVDDQDFKELCDSVKVHGVMQAILVRPLPTGKYEIVAGERRWRAARKNNFSQIPAVVRELTDLQALELQAIENAQRKNLNAAQEARSYQRLIKDHGYTIEKVAEKLSKSKSYVYGQLKILDAPKVILDAVEAGTLPPSTAGLVGRIPNRDLREQAAKVVLNPKLIQDNDFWDFRRSDVLSYRQTKEYFSKVFMVELKGAPFDVKADKLVADVGPCASCPKRAGNLPDFDPKAGRADVCTDPKCFEAKKAAAVALATKAIKQEGRRLLTPAEAEKVFDEDGGTRYGSDFVLTSDQPESYEVKSGVKKRPSWKKLAETAGVETVMAFDPTGKPVELVKKAAVVEVVKKSKENIFDTQVSGGSDAYRAEAAKQREKAKLDQATTFVALTALWGKTVTHRFFSMPGFNEILLDCCLSHAGHDGRWLLCKWLNLDPEKDGYNRPDHEKALKKHFTALTMQQEKEAFLVLLLLSAHLKYSGVKQDDFRAVLKFFKLDGHDFEGTAKAKLAQGKKGVAPTCVETVTLAQAKAETSKPTKRFATVNGVPGKKEAFPLRMAKKAKKKKGGKK